MNLNTDTAESVVMAMAWSAVRQTTPEKSKPIQHTAHATYPPAYSSFDTPASHAAGVISNDRLPSEIAELACDDLQQYIALGCLHFDQGICARQSLTIEDKWQELRTADLSDRSSITVMSKVIQLLHARWIRLFRFEGTPKIQRSLVRVYLLPEDWRRRTVDRNSNNLKVALRNLLPKIDISAGSWAGCPSETKGPYFDPWANAEPVSLYYLFNNLPSPNPVPAKIKNRYARTAINDLLKSAADSLWELYGEQPLPGLRTRLYPYQARSAALMIQREVSPQLQLDPRLEARSSPNGEVFYFGARDGSFLQTPKYYNTTQGGILAETMGLGKTIICLAVILATKGHYPKIPAAHHTPSPVRDRVGKLTEIAASTIGRHSIPAKTYLKQSEANGVGVPHSILRALERNPAFYEITQDVPRNSRMTRIRPPRQLLICSGTIVVVPPNLLDQWQSEIRKHVLEGGVKVLVVDTVSRGRCKARTASHVDEDMRFTSELPVPTALMEYDVILFTRTRFEQEIQDGTDSQGRRATSGVTRGCSCPYIGATRIRDCHCINDLKVYESPLTKLHWLRIIIDEGHSFSSSISNAVLVAKQLKVERRWVISGTPAKNLVGVEMDMSTFQSNRDAIFSLRQSLVEQRKLFIHNEQTIKATKALGTLTSHFLMVQPWNGTKDWDEYVYRHEDIRRKTYSGFASCFSRVLEDLVIKTRPEDVDEDIVLPIMRHRTVYLKPCWFDKMTANMFIQVLRTNAVTSERTGVDYIFQKDSAKARHSLMKNLRQSNFAWTSFSSADVLGTLEASNTYLANVDKRCSQEDEDSLRESSQTVSKLLKSEPWKALCKLHDVGIAIDNWPEDSERSFSLTYPTKPTMIGLARLLDAQSRVDGNTLPRQHLDGLESLGQATREKNLATAVLGHKDSSDQSRHYKNKLPDIYAEEQKPVLGEKVTLQTFILPSQDTIATPSTSAITTVAKSPTRSRKRRLTLADETASLAEDSPLRDTRITGTTSAKLTYLLEKVMKHQAEEKIVIFYDGDNAAFYIAQGLELLHVNHRIYARTVDNTKRSEYVRLFNEVTDVRVLLIDVACGALGLNLNVASVVLIVNPINRPFLEAQAIKRVHRIGQTREVLVETLVLENTIEHAIFNRAKRMSRTDHETVKELEDDASIINIIQSARILPEGPDEESGLASFAPLHTPQQIFGRPNRHGFHHYSHVDRQKADRLQKKAKTSNSGRRPTQRAE